MSDEKTQKRTMTVKIIVSVIVLTIAASCTVGFISYNHQQDMMTAVEIDTIYRNIYINNIDVGGFTKEEALAKLTQKIQQPADAKSIALSSGEHQYSYHFSDFNFQFDFTDALNQAFQYAREGTIKERYEQIIALEKEPIKLTVEPTYNQSTIDDIVTTIEKEVYIQPVNATMARENGAFVTTEGKEGTALDTEGTRTEIKQLLDTQSEGSIPLTLISVPPKYKAADFKDAQSLIGTYTTSYSGKGTGRVTNMEVASSNINNYVVYPDEIFSTNKAFGESTYENGYRNAPVIVSGELVEDIGGGVCQISSTLYNALLYAELDIVERQNHSLKVGYTDWGFDATLAGDYIDLKFKNDTDLPVTIESYLTDNQVVVNIYGKEVHDAGRSLVFRNALVATNPPPATKVTNSPNYRQGQQITKLSPLTGYTYKVYKFIYENGQEVGKEEVNSSTYKARRGEVIVGTGAAPAAPKPAATPAPVAAETPAAE